jgi:hypothetical protein
MLFMKRKILSHMKGERNLQDRKCPQFWRKRVVVATNENC